MKPFQEHWQEIEDHFDFEMVYQVMKVLDWTWGQNENASIPSVAKIKARAKKICKDAYDKKTVIESGGFGAHYEEDSLHLYFIPESWETN